MTKLHPGKQGLSPWIARKNAFISKVELLSEKYRNQPGRNPKDLELWEQLLDDSEIRQKLPVQTFIRMEEQINNFWKTI